MDRLMNTIKTTIGGTVNKNKHAMKNKQTNPVLSILMPTLDDREWFYNRIASKISYQINQNGGEKVVEFLVYKDNREKTTGHKRNVLLQQAKGDFVVFIDDDDDISSDYIKLILSAIKHHPHIDAVGISGEYTENGSNPRRMMTGRQFEWETIGGTYCRYINHISPIKRTIAQQFEFPDKIIGEDYAWMMEVKKSDLIKSDFIIQKQIYFYDYRSKK